MSLIIQQSSWWVPGSTEHWKRAIPNAKALFQLAKPSPVAKATMSVGDDQWENERIMMVIFAKSLPQSNWRVCARKQTRSGSWHSRNYDNKDFVGGNIASLEGAAALRTPGRRRCLVGHPTEPEAERVMTPCGLQATLSGGETATRTPCPSLPGVLAKAFSSSGQMGPPHTPGMARKTGRQWKGGEWGRAPKPPAF